jgi:hypothetical protein
MGFRSTDKSIHVTTQGVFIADPKMRRRWATTLGGTTFLDYPTLVTVNPFDAR